MKIFSLIFFLSLFTANSFALAPEARLADDAQEARAMNLFFEVKCLVCQGQAIESSNTEFSQEMRKLIREKISEGKSDKQIRKELLKEFGPDVLMVQPQNNILLWMLPFLFSAFLAIFFFSYFSKK